MNHQLDLNLGSAIESKTSEWQTARIVDVALKVGSGATPRGGDVVYKASGVPLIRSMNVHFSGFKADGLAYLDTREAKQLDNVTVKAGDVLLNITGASIGRVTVAPATMDGARVNQHVCIIRPNDTLQPSYLAYFLASPSEQARIMNVQVGATRQALTKAMVLAWRVSFPSPSRQKRIVAEIEKQFTRLEVGASSLKRVLVALKRYRASVLKAACEGRLVPTEAELARREGRAFESATVLLERTLADRRKRFTRSGKYLEPERPVIDETAPLPEGWTWATFEQIAERVTVGFVGSMKQEYVDSGVPFLRSQNVRENRFDWEGLLYISPDFHGKLSKSALRPGDLAIVRSGSVGVTCVVPETLPEANCSDLVLVQRPLGFVPQYGAYYMNSLAKQHVAAGKVGVALTHFNTKSVAALVVPLPPLAEQHRIVSEVERRLSVIEGLEAAVFESLRRAARLRQAILHRAFAGDLVLR